MASLLQRFRHTYLSKTLVLLMDIVLSVLASGLVLVAINVLLGPSLFPLSISRGFHAAYLIGATLYSAIAFLAFQTYRVIIRHLSVRDLVIFLAASLLKAALMLATALAARHYTPSLLFVLSLDALLTLGTLVAVRVLMIQIWEHFNSRIQEKYEYKRVMVYGTSDKSVATIIRLQKSPHYKVIGFLDNGAEGRTIEGLPVFSPKGDEAMEKAVIDNRIDAILFPTDKEAQHEEDHLIRFCSQKGIKCLIVPTVDEVVEGEAILRPREIKVEDLLGREEIKISLDAIQSYGELFSTKIIAAKFASLGIPAVWLDSREIVRTVKGAVDTETTYANVRKAVDACPHTPLFIVPGFIATDSLGRISTLGRGGSDYTASLYAVGINARLVEIWTDVDGMMTANPKVVPTARTIRNISYRAAQELSHFGAKVIYPPTIQPVVEEGIPIYVRNTFHPDGPSTLVEKNPPRVGSGLIGISNSDNIALISLEGSGMVGIPGFSSRLFDALTRSGVNIILITQASSVHTMCIAIAEKDAEKARAASDECFAYEISLGKLNPLKVETGFSIVCLVGDDILGQVGITGRMLAALGSHGIPVRATAQGSSERNISVILPSDRVGDAIRHIHESFFDNSSLRNVNLFIAGYGKVGNELVRIIREGNVRIAERTGKRLRICGLSNSRKFLLNPEGISEFDLSTGQDASGDAFFDALTGISLKNSIFVDCTSSEDIVFRYPGLFKAGYSIVSCNKNPFAGPYETYKALKESALRAGRALRFETTAGAALPVVGTVQGLLDEGDRVTSIEAILSGTLAYLMNG